MRKYLPYIAFGLLGAFTLAAGLWGIAGVSARSFNQEPMLPVVDQMTYPPVPCSNPCVIQFSPGGAIDLFAAQGRQLAADHTLVIVDGPCISACTILVDLARANVCLTRNAVLGYHQWTMEAPDGDEKHGDVSYETPGLDAYLKARGGLPYTPDTGHILMLNFSEASRFYKPCAGVA